MRDTSVSLKIHDMQAMAYLGKADELLHWSADLRGLQLPQLPTSLLYPWQPADKASQPAKSGSAEAEQRHTKEKLRGDRECSTTSSLEKGIEGMSASSSESNRDLADAARTESVSPAPQHQTEAVLVGIPAVGSSPQPDHNEKESTEQSTPDNHAHHIWSSWLRWQDRSVITPCLAYCVSAYTITRSSTEVSHSWRNKRAHVNVLT